MDKTKNITIKYPLAEVVWRDCALYEAEFAADFPFQICTFHTSGYLVKETNDYVMLVREYRVRNGDELRYRGSTLIPKENIVSFRVIK